MNVRIAVTPAEVADYNTASYNDINNVGYISVGSGQKSRYQSYRSLDLLGPLPDTYVTSMSLFNTIGSTLQVANNSLGLPPVTFELAVWVIGAGAAGGESLTVVGAPAAAAAGTNGTVTLAFGGDLDPTQRYVGAVLYGPDNIAAPTIVTVSPAQPPAPPPRPPMPPSPPLPPPELDFPPAPPPPQQNGEAVVHLLLSAKHTLGRSRRWHRWHGA